MWICLLGIGILVTLFQTESNEEEFQNLFQEQQGVIVQGRIYKKEIKQDRNILYLKDVRILNKNEYMAAEGRLPVYLAEEYEGQMPEIGKIVQISGSVKTIPESRNPGNFNQKYYYQKQDIYWMFQNAVLEKSGGKSDTFHEGLWKLRQYLSLRVIEQMDTRCGGVLCAMLFGNTNYVDAEVKELYQKTGIGHLLAVSSLHMNFWGLGLCEVLKRMRFPKKISLFAGIIFLAVYVVFAGASVSAVRAFIMFAIRMGAVLVGREYDGLTALSFAALIQLIQNPIQIYDAGFLLSYGAVLGIYLIGPALEEHLGNKIGIPLAVQLGLFPITLYFYYEMCSYSFVWNLLAVPASSVVLFFGAIGILFSPAFFISELVLKLYETGCNLILEIPGARCIIGQPAMGQILLYYVCLSVVIGCLYKKKGKKSILLLALIGAGVLVVPQQISKEMEVTMLDVGQGDCFFVKMPSGEACLIDGGSSSVNAVGQYRIEPFLKYKGIDSLDYVFISHGDTDHVNGIAELLERKKVGVAIKRLVLPPKRLWEEKLTDLANLAVEKGVAVYEMKQGQQLIVGETRMVCLWPSEEVTEAGNEASMVLSITYDQLDILFTGDLENESEAVVCGYMEQLQAQGILPEKYEVLKVGHHGSRNSTGKELLGLCKPDIAMISAGEGNSYGHPHEEVLERLEEVKCIISSTHNEGAIEITYDKAKVLLHKD